MYHLLVHVIPLPLYPVRQVQVNPGVVSKQSALTSQSLVRSAHSSTSKGEEEEVNGKKNETFEEIQDEMKLRSYCLNLYRCGNIVPVLILAASESVLCVSAVCTKYFINR